VLAGVLGCGSGDEAASRPEAIPCAPRRVLETVCQRCHGDPLQNDAPFPLRSREDVTRVRGGSPTYEKMRAQVDSRRMPLAPVTLGDADRETLLAWLRAGAPPAAEETCP